MHRYVSERIESCAALARFPGPGRIYFLVGQGVVAQSSSCLGFTSTALAWRGVAGFNLWIAFARLDPADLRGVDSTSLCDLFLRQPETLTCLAQIGA